MLSGEVETVNQKLVVLGAKCETVTNRSSSAITSVLTIENANKSFK